MRSGGMRRPVAVIDVSNMAIDQMPIYMCVTRSASLAGSWYDTEEESGVGLYNGGIRQGWVHSSSGICTRQYAKLAAKER
jgi:hypothetical protein